MCEWGVLTTCGQRVMGMDNKARRDIWGPRWDLGTWDGVLCWSAGGKELKFTG